MTAACDMDLWKYKLVPEEWNIAGELRDVLKVSYYYILHTYLYSLKNRFLRMLHSFFHAEHPTSPL